MKAATAYALLLVAATFLPLPTTDEPLAHEQYQEEPDGSATADLAVSDSDSAAPGAAVPDLLPTDDDAGADGPTGELAPLAACRGRYCFDAQDVLAVFARVGPRTQCVMRREMGPRLDPNAIGQAGEIGPIQLHARGKLPEFLRTGLDPWNPYDTAPWLQAQILAGQGFHWSPIRLGLC